MSSTPTGSMPSSTLFGIVDQQREARLSLDKFVEMDSPSVFPYEHQGDAMSPYILDGDRLILDRSKSYSHNSLILAEYNGEVFCRYFLINNNRIILHPHNKSYRDISPQEGETLKILGVVTYIVRSA